MEESAPGKSVAFVTLGCAKNEVDSRTMAGLAAQAGYGIAEDPACADAIVINTCSFIQAATEESIEAILEAAALEGVRGGDVPLIVAGCMPARYGNELQPELPEAAAFVPCSDEGAIVSILDRLLGTVSADAAATAPLILPDGDPAAYVKISDGCDRFCSYCTIPFIRGRYHSFPADEIQREVDGLIAAGKREIILIAQDTGRWGTDFPEPSTLADLVSSLAEAHPDTWFRLMYIQPEGVTDELIAAVASHGNICSYFDIPLQHCNGTILKAMNRSGDSRSFLELAAKLRRSLPDVALRTTLICGFPGETEEEFDELCAFVEEAEFDYVGIFPFSPEEGTRALELPGQVDEQTKMERTQHLRDLADTVSAAVIGRRIGSEAAVLVCGCEEDGQRFGRTQAQAPEVDGVTYVDGGKPGDLLSCLITDTLLYEMEGEIHGC